MKKKIIALCLCIAMVTIAIASGTLAYFTDTKEQTNTFTAGKVAITLDEAKVKLDENPKSDTFGDLIADGTDRVIAPDNPEPYHLFPAMDVLKDPTITLVAGSEDAYLAAIITVKIPNADLELMRSNRMNLVDPTHEDMLMVGGLLSGSEYVQTISPKNHPLSGVNNMPVYGPAENENSKGYSVYQIPDSKNETWTIYMFFEDVQSAPADAENPTSIMLFEQINVPEAWDNAEMAVVNGMTIEVAAYAAQANGFADCYTAMTTAFPGVFPVAEQN